MRSRSVTILASVALLSASAVMRAQQTPSFEGPPRQPGQLRQPLMKDATNYLPDTVSASPLSTRDKFTYHAIESFGFKGYLGSALSAGISQWQNSPRRWGQGAEGYGLRYGSSFGADVTRQSFAGGLESALHEDPRYFPSVDKRNKKQRLINALKQVLITKEDSGADGFAYARVISAFGAGQFVNIWQPRGSNSFTDGLERGCVTIAGDAAYNLLQEFFRFTRPAALRDHKPSAPTTP